MTEPLRDFFVQEATEYLDRFAAALAVEGRPDFDRLRRLGRALRGSARMADQHAIARVAGAVQAMAEDLGNGERKWDSEMLPELKSVIGEMRRLVDDVHAPPADFDERADALAKRLGAGSVPRLARAAAEPAMDDERFRRYLGTELRRLATEITRAIEVLEQEPRERDPLKALLRRIRPLRGVQALGETPSAGPALAAVEEVILRIADTQATVGPGHLALFRRAQQSLLEVADDLLSGAEPSSSAARRAEIEDLRDRALKSTGQTEVVWISTLFPEEEGPHVLECPMAQRGAGSWEAFFALEATGGLDTADRLRAEMARDPGGARQSGQRLAYAFRQLRERALTFGHQGLGRLTDRADSLIRAHLDERPGRLQELAEVLEEVTDALREYLEADEGDPDARRAALRNAERALEVSEVARAAGVGAATEAEETVPVESLTYTAEDALARTLELREEVNRLLRGGPEDVARANEILDEIYGLIEHALARSSPDR